MWSPNFTDISQWRASSQHCRAMSSFSANGTSDGLSPSDVPFALKLDMARQCWDEARHCEMSVKLGDHMGTEIGEVFESTTLFEAACHPDPVCRPARVTRAR